MAVRIVRLGTRRARGEGPRLGTVRRPPRGVRTADYARLGYYDAWLPELAPSARLVSWLSADAADEKRWKGFVRKYRGEMRAPERERLLEVLARLSRHADFSVGCYCADESRCHRSVLRRLLAEHGARIAR
jgi:uncharacterized protein YeaO (DUF488 family)